jgi:hypothetical protein
MQQPERRIVTKGGYKAVLINNQIIRLSESSKRLEEDGETYDEFKVRTKLNKKMKRKFLIKSK